MTATTSPAPPPAVDTAPRRPWYRRPGGIGVALVVIGSFTLWTYAFSGLAKKDPPDTLRDKAYTAQAEAVCAPFRATVDALPPAPAAKSPEDRAGVLLQANDALTAMVAQLKTLEPDNEFDRAIVTKWLADWDHFLADRRDYQQVLSTGQDAQFTLTATVANIYTKSMDNLAEVNDMDACATPGDV